MIVDISSRRGYSYWMTIDNKALSTQIMFLLINPWNYFCTISIINVVDAAAAVAVALFFFHLCNKYITGVSERVTVEDLKKNML
jgi:hypothetical protein